MEKKWYFDFKERYMDSNFRHCIGMMNLVSFLLDHELYQVSGVNCLFTNESMNLIFFVDDTMITYHTQDSQKVYLFEEFFTRRLEVRRISRYIESLKATFNIEAAKPPKTPLPSAELNKFEGTATLAQIKGYQQKFGKVNFAAVSTRPDIARAVSVLSKFLQNPGSQHLDAIDHLQKYLAYTSSLSICYDGKYYLQNTISTNRAFMTFSDASYGDDSETRHSSCGFALLLYGGIVHYKATKQRAVTTSSTEAELLSFSVLAKEYMWLMRLFDHIGLQLNNEGVISLDNQQTIRLITSEASKLVTKLKHINIHQLWIRQEHKSGRVKVEWVPTAEMVADGFTNELSPQKHSAFCWKLVLVPGG